MIVNSSNSYHRFAKNQVQKALARRISRVFRARQCSRKGARRVEERKKKKTKMTTPEFHRFLVRHVSNIFELSLAIARNGATPESRFIMCLAYKIYHQVKYQRLNANTCIVAAILFSAHPYIDRTTVRSN